MKVPAKLKAIPICPICKTIDADFVAEINKTRTILALPDYVGIHRWECCGKLIDVPVMRLEIDRDPPQWWPVVCIELQNEGLPN